MKIKILILFISLYFLFLSVSCIYPDLPLSKMPTEFYILEYIENIRIKTGNEYFRSEEGYLDVYDDKDATKFIFKIGYHYRSGWAHNPGKDFIELSKKFGDKGFKGIVGDIFEQAIADTIKSFDIVVSEDFFNFKKRRIYK